MAGRTRKNIAGKITETERNWRKKKAERRKENKKRRRKASEEKCYWTKEENWWRNQEVDGWKKIIADQTRNPILNINFVLKMYFKWPKYNK